MLQNVWKVWKRILVKINPSIIFSTQHSLPLNWPGVRVNEVDQSCFKYILSIVTHLQKLETWQKKSCKLLYRCIYLCQQDIKLYASNFKSIVHQKQFTVFDMSKNLFVVVKVNKCHLISHLSSCSTLWQLCAAMMNWVRRWVELLVYLKIQSFLSYMEKIAKSFS